MPRTVRDARLETRAARAKLPPRGDREPYWRAIGTGQHVGYYKGIEGGTWLARWRPPGGSYKKRKLGLADDARDADGVRVFSYSQAQARAREVFSELDRQHEGTEPVPTGPYRVRDAIADYLDWFERHRKSASITSAAAKRAILPEIGERRYWPADRSLHPPVARRHRGLATGDPSQAERRQGEFPTRPVARGRGRTCAARDREPLADDFEGGAQLRLQGGQDPVRFRVAAGKAFRGADSARVGYATEDQARRLLNGCHGNFPQARPRRARNGLPIRRADQGPCCGLQPGWAIVAGPGCEKREEPARPARQAGGGVPREHYRRAGRQRAPFHP